MLFTLIYCNIVKSSILQASEQEQRPIQSTCCKYILSFITVFQQALTVTWNKCADKNHKNHA